jgi:hypothetical protein
VTWRVSLGHKEASLLRSNSAEFLVAALVSFAVHWMAASRSMLCTQISYNLEKGAMGTAQRLMQTQNVCGRRTMKSFDIILHRDS